MDNGRNGEFKQIYYGKNVPSLSTYTVDNLTPGLIYRFKVVAENFNGFGPESPISSIYSCVNPSDFDSL